MRWILRMAGEGRSRSLGRNGGGLRCGGVSWFRERERKRGNVPSLMTSRKASRSSGNFATGLQKFQLWPAQSSTVRARWWGVMVHATVLPRDLTRSTAARVVACSRTMRRLGKRAWRERRWGRKRGSALRMWVF